MSGFDVRLVRHGLPGALGEPDQLLRLARFRAAHPEVIIGDGGFGTVQVLAATLFAHGPAAFDVDIPAGLGGDLLLWRRSGWVVAGGGLAR